QAAVGIRDFRVTGVQTCALPISEYPTETVNTGQADIPDDDPAIVTDALADVLDDATATGDVTASTGTAEITGSTLTWTGGLGVRSEERRVETGCRASWGPSDEDT